MRTHAAWRGWRFINGGAEAAAVGMRAKKRRNPNSIRFIFMCLVHISPGALFCTTHSLTTTHLHNPGMPSSADAAGQSAKFRVRHILSLAVKFFNRRVCRTLFINTLVANLYCTWGTKDITLPQSRQKVQTIQVLKRELYFQSNKLHFCYILKARISKIT